MQYKIYALALPFDLRYESGTYTSLHYCVYHVWLGKKILLLENMTIVTGWITKFVGLLIFLLISSWVACSNKYFLLGQNKILFMFAMLCNGWAKANMKCTGMDYKLFHQFMGGAHMKVMFTAPFSAETNFQPRSNIYDYNLDESTVTLHSCIPFYQSNQLPQPLP